MIHKRGQRWYYRFQYRGRDHVRSTGLVATGENRAAAEAIEAQVKLDLIQGAHGIRQVRPRLFTDAAAEFLRWAITEYREHPNSYTRIKTSFSSLSDLLGRLMVYDVQEGAIESYKTWRRTERQAGERKIPAVAEVTLRHDLHSLSLFFQWATGQRYCRDNPVRRVAIPSDKDSVRIHVITRHEEARYFAHATGAVADLSRLMRNQGCRPGELLALAKRSVDLDRRMLWIERGKSAAARRRLDLVDETVAILARRMPGPSQWVFPTPRQYRRGAGRPADTHIKTLHGAHDGACRRAGLDFVLYDWRHTFATRMAEAGCDLPTLARILGHASIRLVLRYVHPTDDHQRAAMQRYEAAMLAAQAIDHRPS